MTYAPAMMNFAYGELIMAGAYVMFYTRSWGWLPVLRLVLLVVAPPLLPAQLGLARDARHGRADRDRALAPDGARCVQTAPPRRAGRVAHHLVRRELRTGGARLDDRRLGHPERRDALPVADEAVERRRGADLEARDRHVGRDDRAARRDDAADQAHDTRDPAAGVHGGLPDGAARRRSRQPGDLGRARDHRPPGQRGRGALHLPLGRRLARHRA